MKAIILAAGYGTRLGLNIPKHLVKVADKEVVMWLLEKLEKIDEIDEIYIVTNDWAYQPTVDCLKHYDGKPVKIFNDGTKSNEERLGSIGDMIYVINEIKLDDDVLILAGDNMFEFSLPEFISFFQQTGDSVVAIDVKDFELAKRFGIIDVDETKQIKSFVEKPENPPSTLAATACYLYRKETIPVLKNYANLGKDLDKSGSFVQYLHNEKPVYAWITDKTWIDIGTKDQLEKANEKFTFYK